ncbi:GSCOCG00006047001-RA-CDS, partial [Cotesia congregata]
WIKGLLGKAGTDTKQFSAYSTRHAAVSSAHKVGVNIDTIRRTAGWTERSKMFAKFYNKLIRESKEQFVRAIINNKN